MLAMVTTTAGLAPQQVPDPSIGPDDVLIRVRAIALNRMDIVLASGGQYGKVGGPGTIPGLEWAGEIISCGPNVPKRLTPGMRVMATGMGGFAELARTDWGRVSALPNDSLSMAEASTLPMALQTMHDALVTQGGLRAGQDLLVVGAGSGVGLMGVVMARAIGATKIVATSTSSERRARLLEYGADLAVSTGEAGWHEKVLAATGGNGVDVTIDLVSGGTVNGSMAATKINGAVVNVGRLGGGSIGFDAELHALRRLRYIGVTFRTRSVQDVRSINERMWKDLGDFIGRGKLRLPFISYPFGKATEALEMMRANKHFGKIVLEL